MSFKSELLQELETLLFTGTRDTSQFPKVSSIIVGLREDSPKTPPTTESVMEKWVKHKKRGSHYFVVTEGVLQTDKPLFDNTKLLSYADAEGNIWHRTPEEFMDGRFATVEDVAPVSETPSDDAILD